MKAIMLKRIQRKRTKGWRMPENCVYVGRPSIWGNPFTGDRAVEKYEAAISTYLNTKRHVQYWDADDYTTSKLHSHFEYICRNLHKLKGKDLVCWCPLDKPCHADVLLQIANEEVCEHESNNTDGI